MKAKIKLDVTIHNEFIDQCPDLAYVELGAEDIKHLLNLKRVMKEHHIDRISNYDDSPTFMVEIRDDSYEVTEEQEYVEFRYECLMLNICADIVYWSFLIKNTDIHGELVGVTFEFLNELLSALTMPIENLPTLINAENNTIREVVNKRMKHG